jgi:large subunit ribosomal protein L15
LIQKKLKKELTFDNIILLQLAEKNDLVKILGRGKIDVPVKVSAHKFSTSAKKAIENAGGEIISI